MTSYVPSTGPYSVGAGFGRLRRRWAPRQVHDDNHQGECRYERDKKLLPDIG